MAQTDTIKLAGISADTPFSLRGGIYLAAARSAAWGAGSAALQVLGADGATFVPVKLNGAAVSFNADGTLSPLYLPPGQYKAVITGGITADFLISAIPPSVVL